MKKLLGIVVLGVAIKLLLDSEKGEEIKKEVRRWWDEMEDTINEAVKKALDKVEDTAAKVDNVLPGSDV